MSSSTEQNRPALFLWLSIHISGKNHFHLVLPIPIYSLLIFADIMDDISVLRRLFVSRRNDHPVPPPEEMESSYKKYLRPTPEMFQSISDIVSRVLYAIVFQWGVGEIVDVDIQSPDQHVKVNCSLR